MLKAKLSDLLSACRSAGPPVKVIAGMRGLGDNVYQRAFLSQFHEDVYLETPWPELYVDMPHVKPVKPYTTLRTQLKNMNRFDGWHAVPIYRQSQRIEYRREPIFDGMRRTFCVQPGALTLPDFGPSPIRGRYAVIRPVTVRSEWRADARNPLPEYVNEAASILRENGITLVSVADLEDGKEWLVGDAPQADIKFHHGELDVRQLLALIQHAHCVVGGIGWIVPASIAASVPAWIICGGQGGYNSPARITDPTMNINKISFAVPDRFCQCTEKVHDCDKRISGHRDSFAEWLRGLPALV